MLSLWFSMALASTALHSASASPLILALNHVNKREYQDGEGTYAGTDGEHRYASGVKCWTDYFAVTAETSSTGAFQASDQVDCSGSSQCQVSKMTGKQTCQTWSAGISPQVQLGIIQIGITGGWAVQDCSMAQDTTSCTWNDGQCHVIMAEQPLLLQKGYARRRCTSNSGDYTASMYGWEHTAPLGEPKYECNGGCSI